MPAEMRFPCLRTFDPSSRAGDSCVRTPRLRRSCSQTYARNTRTGVRSGRSVPRQAKNFLKWRIWPIADKLGIPRKLVTFQVMRRTLGTDLQRYGTMKDAQQILRHASIRTTANVYMQQIPASVVAAINARTRAILAAGRELSSETQSTTGSNGLQFEKGVLASA